MAKVKICGLRTLADVELVNRYQPEYAGFVFASTRRFVTDEQALLMRKKLEIGRASCRERVSSCV